MGLIELPFEQQVRRVPEDISREQLLLWGVKPFYARQIKEVILTPPEYDAVVSSLAGIISQEYRNADFSTDPYLRLIGITNGAVTFLADLAREITHPCQWDTMDASSYGSRTASSGNVTFSKKLKIEVTGHNVIVVEDIADTGFTLTDIIDWLQSKNPLTLATCCLLDKPSKREVEGLILDYIGAIVGGDKFVIGAGLDALECGRDVRGVYVLHDTESNSLTK